VTKSEFQRKRYELNEYFLGAGIKFELFYIQNTNATKNANLCLLSNMQGMKNVKFLIVNSYLKGKIFMGKKSTVGDAHRRQRVPSVTYTDDKEYRR
jgi:hypothetical protein